MKITVAALIALCLFSSCGKEDAKEDAAIIPNNNEYNFTTEMRAETLLSDGEFTVAKNICESFESMESRLQSVGGSLSLRMQVRNKTCTQIGDSTYEAGARIVSSRGSGINLNLSSRTTQTFTDVLSVGHPRLSPFCKSVLNGVNPSNTVKNGNLRYQVSFYERENFEWVQIVEFRPVNGRFMPYLIENSAVITPYANVNRENLGFTRSRTLNTSCSGGQSAYQFQLWL